MRAPLIASAAAMFLLVTASASAQELAPQETPPPPAAKPAPAPYVVPFALRSTASLTGVRMETAYGLDTDVSSTIVQYLTGTYVPVEHLALYARMGVVDFLPNKGATSNAITNMAIGGQWAGTFARDFRYSATIGTSLPIGEGGGDNPDPGEAAAISAGNLARARYDGSTMFSPDFIAPFIGGDIAFVRGGFTVQAEVTVFGLFRVRGGGINPATNKPWDPDEERASIDLALHAGYFIIPELSVQAELRDQTFLSTPASVASDTISRSWVSVGGGVRGHVKLGKKAWFRPGLAFFQPLNDAIMKPTLHTASSYHIFQLDLPFYF